MRNFIEGFSHVKIYYVRMDTMHFENLPSCKGYSLLKIFTFASKIKIPKNMSKSILQIIYSCSVQKTDRKNSKYSKNERILKIGHLAKAFAKSSPWVKN